MEINKLNTSKLLVCLVILTSCKSRFEYFFLRSEKVFPEYFCDHYKVESCGVAGDAYRLFLRDSSNTRVFVCDYYDNDIFEYFLNEGKIEIFRFENSYSIGGVMHNKRFIIKYVFD